MFRRRTDPERARILDAFGGAAVAVDAAQRALLAAIPTSRHPGDPMPAALAGFIGLLASAEEAMEPWRAPSVEEDWLRCRAALDRARAEADRLASIPDALEFEALNARIGDVLHPLEAFADAERKLRGR